MRNMGSILIGVTCFQWMFLFLRSNVSDANANGIFANVVCL